VKQRPVEKRNRNLRIRRNKLKLAGENPEVGVYFINEATGELIKVEADEIVDNKPPELILLPPLLLFGRSFQECMIRKLILRFRSGFGLFFTRRSRCSLI
jgi:hypothetical protein